MRADMIDDDDGVRLYLEPGSPGLFEDHDEFNFGFDYGTCPHCGQEKLPVDETGQGSHICQEYEGDQEDGN